MTDLNFTNCDREKIHLIHTIQSHGAFVAVHPLDLKVKHVSTNAPAFFDNSEPHEGLINKRLNDIIPHEVYREIQKLIKSRPRYPFSFIAGKYDLYLYKIEDDLIGIEFEILPDNSEIDHLLIMRDFLELMQGAHNLEELALMACRAVRSLTGMDRVMMYRFFPPTMYGEVIAEDRGAEAHSFMGHRFPSTDIPKPARDLYLRNHVRQIADTSKEPFPIYPASGKHGALDLSDSRLRGVSLIHLEYLKNMDVVGSFSIAVKVDHKLWGLIACHHTSPIHITQKVRSSCDNVANCFALSAPLLLRSTQQFSEISLNNRLNSVFNILKNSASPMEDILRKETDLNTTFGTTGFAVINKNQIQSAGITPLSKDLKALAEWIYKRLVDTNKETFITDSLSVMDEQWTKIKDHASGVLAIRLSEFDESLLLFFRPEILQTIQWGGDPRKNFEQRNYQGQVNPRASFETWTEVIKFTSQPWLAHEVEGIRNFKNIVFDSLIKKVDLISELGKQLKR